MNRRFKFVVVMAAIALVGLATGVAIAQVAGVTTAAGKAISKVSVARGQDATQTGSGSYVDIPGAQVNISVPSGHQALLLARFSAESACSATTTSGNWCTVQILVDGQPAQPASGSDFAFDSTDNGREGAASWESHSMDRSLVVGGGAHTVTVQYATVGTSTSFRIDDWSLTVERSDK